MRCYKCESDQLELAPLWPYERTTYAVANIVLRQCQHCGLVQNHVGHDEPLQPADVARDAPPHKGQG